MTTLIVVINWSDYDNSTTRMEKSRSIFTDTVYFWFSVTIKQTGWSWKKEKFSNFLLFEQLCSENWQKDFFTHLQGVSQLGLPLVMRQQPLCSDDAVVVAGDSLKIDHLHSHWRRVVYPVQLLQLHQMENRIMNSLSGHDPNMLKLKKKNCKFLNKSF